MGRFFGYLKEHLRTRSFHIHFDWRMPRAGRGLGSDGVRDRTRVLTYARVLELGYDRMAKGEFEWKLRAPKNGRTNVYIYDTLALPSRPFGIASVDDQGFPCLHLASWGSEISINTELLRATATAIHELSHTFTMTWRFPVHGHDPWQWWDEGTAVFMETHISPENPDSLRFLASWVDHPETSLDTSANKYQAGMFMRYLFYHAQLGADFITKVWKKASTCTTALDALTQILAGRHPNLSLASASRDDVFASGYCVHAYFCFDAASPCFSPFVFARYGERQVTETFPQYPVKNADSRDTVDHLACRYYRFLPSRGSGSHHLEVRLTPNPQSAISSLKGILIGVDQSWQKGNTVVLKQTTDGTELEGKLDGFTSRNLAHAVLVVVNCSYGDNAQDGLGYSISAKVV